MRRKSPRKTTRATFANARFLAALVALASLFASEALSAQPLRIGYQSSPPYQVIKEDGTVEGIAIDIIRAAAERLDIQLEWIHCPRSPDYHFAAKQVDLWPVVTELPHRLSQIYISKPIYQNSIGILSLKTAPVTSPKDTNGKQVAYYDREPSLTLVPKLLPDAVPVPLPSHVEAIDSVLSGQNHAAFLWSTKTNSVDFKKAIDEHPETEIHFYAFPNQKLSCGIGADKDNPQSIAAADRLREEVRSLVQEGVVQNVYFKYFLDPENEISSYFYLDDLRLKATKLTVAISILAVLLAALAASLLILRNSRKKAQAANKAKTAFLANMSHEFRTPLNGIMGMTQLAILDTTNDEQKELLEIVMQSANALLTIVNDILDLSKTESDRLVIEAEPLRLDDLLKSITPFFELVAVQKGLRFQTSVSPDCPATFVSDVVRLRQILFNLIGNAVKFTRSGKVSVSVDTLQISNQSHIVFEISDTGVGVPENLHNGIFDVFTQGDDSISRGYGGTGIGLTIARQLTRLLGGEIHLESVVNKGSVFSVLIPLVQAKTDTPQASHNPESRLLSFAKKLKILVVDDNPINLQTMQAVLELLNYEVTTAADGPSAIQRCETTAFDLVFMDLQMPGMDGWETARAIRSNAKSKSAPPIIALTASIFSEERKASVLQEMDGLIFKPFEIKRLQSEIIRATSSFHSP